MFELFCFVFIIEQLFFFDGIYFVIFKSYLDFFCVKYRRWLCGIQNMMKILKVVNNKEDDNNNNNLYLNVNNNNEK